LTEAITSCELQDLLEQTITTGIPLRRELTITHPLEHIVEVHLAPVEVEEHTLGVVIVLYDITQQRRLEHIHKDFVANVSHELRTPVASIRAMAETLLDAGDDQQEIATEFLQTIIGESERLTSLLEDLLNLARIESGNRMVTLEAFDLAELIRHVAQRVMAPVTEKHQQLILELPEELMVMADRDALFQIMINLLDNARKYSPDGGVISVSAFLTDVLRIAVTDTGYGIPPVEIERIFERFYRVDKARSRAQGGTGLGLAIVKHLVEIQGGQITVRSEVGAGSTFTVILPQPDLVARMTEEAGELPHDVSVLTRQGIEIGG
jgi:two-component system phosphate regulon sensor histidine kinase PhoR